VVAPHCVPIVVPKVFYLVSFLPVDQLEISLGVTPGKGPMKEETSRRPWVLWLCYLTFSRSAYVSLCLSVVGSHLAGVHEQGEGETR
jgi:hypothetical protein